MSSDADQHDPLIGQLFHHKYRIVSKIGTGGFGSVYEARDERGAGNRVAIKIIRPEVARTVGLLRHFKNEARRVTRLSHSNIVDWKVFDETEDGTQYFVMELVEGEELDRVLAREGPLPPRRVANILLQILDALRAAHHLSASESILHLDLKPRNVFVLRGRRAGEEHVKVIDFGIGQYIGGEEEEEVPDLTSDTPPRMLPGDTTFDPTTSSFVRPDSEGDFGEQPTGFKRSTACTPEYASPEQCVHVLGLADVVALDGRSDVYSLGVMGFQMLTGHLPFARPLVRGDMLRLHMQRPPNKVASMGVRLPRNLARFIDRCLAKDRDQRFKDTNEAYEAMHKIVHPPVWQTVTKVAAPLLILVVVTLVGWATKVGARAPVVGLKVADGDVDLARDGLYMGPQRSSVVLALASTRGVDTGGAPALRVVRPEDGSELTGWRAEWDSAHRISIARTDGEPRRVDARVEIVTDENDLELSPFSLTWLGSEAWTIDRVELGGCPLAELAGRAVDPLGQRLRVWIGGEARGDIDGVKLAIGDQVTSLVPRDSQTERALYEIALDDLSLPDGPCEISIAARDRADRSQDQKQGLTIASDALEAIETKLLSRTAAAGSSALPECIRLAGRYSLTPRTQPVLSLAFNRNADLQFWVSKDGQDGSTPARTVKGGDTFTIDLTELASDARYSGSIRFEASDEPYVLHAEGSSRGVLRGAPIVFSFLDVAPDVHVRLEDEDRRSQSVVEGSPAYTNELEPKLVVQRKAPLAMKIVARYAPTSDPGADVSEESSALRDLQQNEATLSPRFRGDGRYELRLAVFQIDSTTDATGDRPDLDLVRAIVVDTELPVVVLEGLDPKTVVTRERPFANELGVRIASDVTAPAHASPVDVSYELKSRVPNGAVRRGEVGRDLIGGARAPLAIASMWSGDDALPDGKYELAITAVDRAGNKARACRAEFEVGLHGPDVTVDAPRTDRKWLDAGGQWPIRLSAADPNGIARVECTLLAKSDDSDGLAVAVASDSENASDPVFTGAVPLTDAWSEAKVWIRLRAWDRLGTPSEPAIEGPYSLPVIQPPRPEIVEAITSNGSVARMRLVRGNDEFSYTFQGQGDAKENRAFKDADLPAFNKNFRQSREDSWQIEYERGDVQPFYLDEHEVSVGEYLAFVRQGAEGYANAAHWPAGSRAIDDARRGALEADLGSAPVELPVTNVTWEEAFAYAKWVGKRLPSWVEWEYATRGGPQYRPYAGYDPVKKKIARASVNVDWDGRGEARGPWPRGRGEDRTLDTGVWNLAGNVAEWTATPVYFVADRDTSEDVAKHAARHRAQLLDPTLMEEWERCRRFWVAGGSFESARCDFSVVRDERRTRASSALGFRCAASLKDVQRGLERGCFREASP